MTDDGDLVDEFSRLRLQLMLPLRMTKNKTLEDADLAPLFEALDRLKSDLRPDSRISVELAGVVWGTITDLMNEAAHAIDPETLRLRASEVEWAIGTVFRRSPSPDSSVSDGETTSLPLDVLTLAYLARQGPLEYVHFWSHRPREGAGQWPYCLSQWWPARFSVDGLEFFTAEHYMMWRKATLFGDRVKAEAILRADSPAETKALGREIVGFQSQAWRRARVDTVVTGNLAKFSQNEDISALLLDSGESVLVEASPVDRIWGIGLAASHPDANNPLRWRGENLLGFALMQVRETLRQTML